MESIPKFFYNIIPGAIFLLTASYLFPQESFRLFKVIPLISKSSSIETSIIFISASLLIGFTFQGFTRFIKDRFIFDQIFSEIKNTYTFKIFEEEKSNLNKLVGKGSSFENEKDRLKRIFFMIANYLYVNKKNDSADHFGYQNAFWSNNMWTSLIIFFLAPFSQKGTLMISTMSIIAILISYTLFRRNLKLMYETALLSFIVDRKFPSKPSSSK